MKFADYIQREPINPVDLGLLERTYNTLEQGHQESIKRASELKTAMAQLELNEAESQWRQNKLNQIEKTIEDNTIYGNAYGALDDLEKLSGDLMADQGLYGRLKAQKDYTDYLNNLDKRTDISEATKEYYRDKNKYSYSETVDADTGKVVNYSSWQPTEREVSEVPLSTILENARKWMIEDSGFTTEFSFLDENGNVVTDPMQSHTGEIYMKKGNQWVKMSEDKVRQAIEASINSIPGAKESLQQDYKVAKWRYNKYGNEGGTQNPLIDKNGQIRTAEEFLEARINPFVKTNTYYKSHPTVEYGDALKTYKLAQINKELAEEQANQQDTKYNEIKTSLSSPTHPIRLVNTFATESVQELNYINENLSRILKESFPNENIDVKKITSTELFNYYDKLYNAGDKNAAEFYDYYIKRKVNENYLAQIKEGSDEQDVAAFDLYNAIDAMGDLPEDDYGYREGYNTLFNNFWNGDRQAIRQYFVHDDTYQEFINNLGGEDAAKELGITFGVNNGKKYVELNEENKFAFEKFARAAQNAIRDTHNLFGQTWQDTKQKFNRNAGDNAIAIVNGEEKPIYDISRSDIYSRPTNNGAYIYGDYIRYVDRLKQQRDEVYKQPYLTIETEATSQATPGLVELATIMKTDPESASKFSTAYKVEEEEVKNTILTGLDLTRKGAFILNSDSNLFEEVSSKKEKEVTQLLRTAKSTDINVMCIFDPKTGLPSPLINLKYKEGNKDKNITFYAIGGFDNTTIEGWNNDTEFKAKNDIVRYTAAGKGLEVVDYESFGDMTKLVIQPTSSGYTLKRSRGGNIPISQEETIELRKMYYDWSQTLHYAKLYPEQINKNALNSIIETTAKTLSKYIDGGGTEAYYIDHLTKQLQKSL